MAQGTSLAVIAATSRVGSVHYRQANLRSPIALMMLTPAAVLLGVGGAHLAAFADNRWLTRIFVVVAITMALWLLLGRESLL